MRRLLGYLVAVAIVAGSIWLAAYLVSLAPEPERREPPPQVPFVQTGRAVAASGAIPIYGAGTVRPSAEIDVAPLVSGSVAWLNPAFQSGGQIKAGETILRIDDADYVFRLREAEADLEARQAVLLETQEVAEIARTEFEQFSQLQREAGSSAGQLGPLALKEPQLKAAQAGLRLAEVRIEDAKLGLSRTEVLAPFDGYVLSESVEAGQFISAGQVFGRLYSADAVDVAVPLSDSNAALIPGLWQLRAGDSERRVAARVIAAYGDARYAWNGYVDRAEASVDKQTRTIDAIVRVPNPFKAGALVDGTRQPRGGPPLLVGRFVDVEIRGFVPESYFRLPRAALRTGDEAWVVSDEKVSIVPVRALQRSNDEALVIGDLQDGQLVITGGIQFVTEGMVVQTGAGSAQ